MHPHKAFEMFVTYVIDGPVEHRDSLGSLETVTDGGAQVIQAGSASTTPKRSAEQAAKPCRSGLSLISANR